MTSDMVAQVQRRGQIVDAPRGVIRTLVVVICDCIRTRLGFHYRCPAWASRRGMATEQQGKPRPEDPRLNEIITEYE